MQCVDYDRAILKYAVGQICHSLGWNSMQQSSLDVLTDIVERYMRKMTKATAGFCQQFEHLDANLQDLEVVFDLLGVRVCELEDYVHQVEPIHFAKSLPLYPAPCAPSLEFATLKEQSNRHEYYGDHLPPLNAVVEDKVPETQSEDNEEKNNEKECISEPMLSQPSINLPQSIEKEEANFSMEGSLMHSPVEQKSLNFALPSQTSDLTRPDLKVSAPKNIVKEMLSPSPKVKLEKLSQDTRPSALEIYPQKRPSEFLTEITGKTESEYKSPPSGNKKLKLSSPATDTEKHLSQTKLLKENMKKEVNDNFSLDVLKSNLSTNKAAESPGLDFDVLSNSQRFQTVGHFNSPNESRLNERLFSTPKTEISSPIMADDAKPLQSVGSNTLKVDKKGKKVKKMKKNKKSPSKSESKKQKSAATSFLGSPMLFASPHLLKSPPDPTVPSSLCSVPVQRLEVKSQKEVSALELSKVSVKKEKGSGKKNADAHPVQLSLKESSVQKKEKKGKKKTNKQLAQQNFAGIDVSSKTSSLQSAMEAKSPVTSPARKKGTTTKNVEMKSPESLKSYNVVQSEDKHLFSPYSSSPAESLDTFSPKWSKQVVKQGKGVNSEEKKHKKEKKTKKKDKSQSGVVSYEDKKSSTPSLKLTFKRSMPENQHSDIITAPKSKYPVVSPSASFPIQSPSPKASPHQVVTPQKFPKAKKAKKDTSLVLSFDSGSKAKTKFEPAVKIEPLVVNEPSSKQQTPIVEKSEKKKKADSKKDSSKKDESTKSGSASKKGDSAKKNDSTVKGDSSKKGSAKKSDSSKKSSASKKNEAFQTEPLHKSPIASTPTAEQSVSRGLFIQTITEAPTTQVWYCPSCLRPDDGSPMIGCDSCDGWYHWTCVGITEDPVDDAEWFCTVCIEKMNKKKTKRRKKKE